MSAKLLTKSELAERLQCEEKTVNWLVSSRQIDFIRIGKSVRFEERAVNTLVDKRRIKAVD